MKKKNYTIAYILLTLASILIIMPILFALIKATQNRAQVLSPMMRPGSDLITNIRYVFSHYHFVLYMKNSLVMAASIMIGKTVLSLFAALAIVYFDFPGKKFIFMFILVTLMMPTEVLIIGLFDLISLRPAASAHEFLKWLSNPVNVFLRPVQYGFGWTDNYLSLIVPFMASATGVFLFRQHFMTIPRSLSDAARIDGAGPIRFMFHILIPMSLNTISALAVIQFVYVWNQYVWPRVIIRKETSQVVQVGLRAIIGTGDGVEWGQVMAGTLMSLIPPLILFLFLQEQFMRGFALSAEK